MKNQFHWNASLKTAKKYQLDTTVCPNPNDEKKKVPINTQNLLTGIYNNKQSLENSVAQ